ncbi:SurA N-terminal domain-containing protein [Streptomyces roseicoloratus]|uniref:SurA N-terminal domain-containing protein n=1 Tax=Streptomyces roseicoloratus TaxID=2508722 RepID=A0ABY9RXI0_9ACTN|nr:SurA N-terminal domain-containing protein [Streptomyces roseicoloratus]WMX46667.1 SurA N-terminal domain-containing protein [Streptomyces roseicoloratus]
MHRRTALSVSAAALLAAAPLLTACGSDAHPGAAAVVGGQRIEVSSLQAQVEDVRSAQQASPNAAQLIRETGDLSRQKLHDMIFDRVAEKVAEDHGVTVDRAEVQQARGEFVRQSGGEQQLRAALLQQRGVAPDQVDDVARRAVLMNKIAAKLGATDTPEGQKKLTDAFSRASKALDIDVNPRFGSWDDEKIQLATYTAPWVRQISRTAPEAGA